MDNTSIQVPFVVFESACTRLERTNKRLWITCIILISLLLFTNIGWIYYESQFETFEETTIEAEQDGEGVNIIGGGDVHYGTTGEDNKN